MHAVASDSRDLAMELHGLLVDLDASRFRRANPTARLVAIRDQLTGLLDQTWPDESLRVLQDRLAELAQLLDDHRIDAVWEKGEWSAFRTQALPAYEALAASLRDFEIHVPSLRPTNWSRNVYHGLNALVLVGLVEVFLTPNQVIGCAVAGTILATTLEVIRRVDGRINDLLMRLFHRVAHPHEAHRVNSATWYTWAILLLAVFSDYTAGAVGVAVLGLGDPAAALVGRRFGRVKLIAGRTLEGTLAFVLFGSLAGILVLRVWHPEVGLHVALSAAVFGAAAELFARRIDDNFAIPLAAALGAWLAL